MQSALLQQIGDQLDRQIVVKVGYGGVVMPGDTPISNDSGEVIRNGHEKSRRSATGPRKGTAGRQGPPRGSGSPGAYASFGGSQLGPNPVPEEIETAYPGAAVWPRQDGFWLLTESSLLDGEYRRARIATAISTETECARSWAFWVSELSRAVPIGPRHTYFDGAICAFSPNDGAWSFGAPLVSLLDLHTLWAFRHLHLERLGRWPGPQIAFDYFERIVECRPGELCGCQDPKGRYEDCCLAADAERDPIAALMTYRAFYGTRQPPDQVARFVEGGCEPPPIRDFLPARKSDMERAWNGLLRRSDGVPLPIRSGR